MNDIKDIKRFLGELSRICNEHGFTVDYEGKAGPCLNEIPKDTVVHYGIILPQSATSPGSWTLGQVVKCIEG